MTGTDQHEITHHRDLRESVPYWQSTPGITVRTRSKPSTANFDVIVVGAGISGALVSQALIRGKRRIAVLDRRAPVLGSSMASTAMIQHEIDMPLFKLSQNLAKDDAERVWLRSVRSVKSLFQLVQTLGISCHMSWKKTLYLAGNEYGARALGMEAEARQALGLEATLLDAAQVKRQFQIDRTAAIVSDISASANPAQLTAGILRSAISHGVEMIRDIEISDLVCHGNKVVLATSSGQILTADYAVFCTGYEFLKVLANKNHRIISTWAVASKTGIKVPDWLNKFLVWEASDPYLYFRMADDGRIIAGGEDEASETAYLDESKLKDKARHIAENLAELVNVRIGEPAFHWAAAFGSTRLGMPMIGEVPGYPNVFAAMGYGGNGITFSKIAAEIISAHIDGRNDRDANLFPFR